MKEEVLKSSGNIKEAISNSFVKVLHYQGNYFIYDVNLNTFFKVSQSIALLFGNPSNISISIEEEMEAERSILEFKSKYNAFSSSRPTVCHFSHTYGCVHEMIRNKLGQLILNITNRCNLCCKYCIFSGLNPIARRNSLTNMQKNIISKAINYYLSRCNNTEIPNLGIYGGEPTIVPSILRYAIDAFVSALKGKSYLISMTTNGLGLTPELWEYFHDKKISLLVSVDGPQEIHDRYRVFPNGEGCFKKVAANLEWGLNNYPEYYKRYVSFSITLAPPYKLKERSEFFSTWELSQSESHAIGYVNGIDLKYILPDVDYCSLDKEEEEELLNYQNSLIEGEKGDWLQRRLFSRNFLDIYNRKRSHSNHEVVFPRTCVPGVQRLFVDVDGKFHLCEKILPTCPIGDVWTGIDEIKIHKIINEFITSLEEECCNCWAARFCNLCFMHAVNYEFNPLNRTKYCKNVRNQVEKTMRSYCHILSLNPHAFDHFEINNINGKNRRQ